MDWLAATWQRPNDNREVLMKPKFMIVVDNVFGPMNIIDRIEGLIRRAQYRRWETHQFKVLQVSCGGSHTRRDISCMLRDRGVRVFGHTHDGKHIYFHVPQTQAAWAQYIMDRANVVGVESSLVKNTKPAMPGALPTPWKDVKREFKQLMKW